jgi:hypothetical protein
MRGRLLGFPIVVFLALGCAPQPAAPRYVRPHFLPAAPEGFGSLNVDFQDNLPWPYRVTRLLVVLDGAVLYNRRDAEQGLESNITIARITDLPHGDHTLQLLLGVQFPSGSLDDRYLVELRASNSFSLDRDHTDVVLDAHAGDVTEDFSERLRLQFRVR